jgi:hypothetical protein
VEEAAKWRRYARATEAHFEPDEEITIRTEYPQLDVDVNAYDATDETSATAEFEDDGEVDLVASADDVEPSENPEPVEDDKQ